MEDVERVVVVAVVVVLGLAGWWSWMRGGGRQVVGCVCVVSGVVAGCWCCLEVVDSVARVACIVVLVCGVDVVLAC